MRYKRAVEKLRLLAEGCEEIGYWPPWDEPYLVEMYAFGPVLEGADPLDEAEVAGVIRLPPEEVTWGSRAPRHGTLPGARTLGSRRRLPRPHETLPAAESRSKRTLPLIIRAGSASRGAELAGILA